MQKPKRLTMYQWLGVVSFVATGTFFLMAYISETVEARVNTYFQIVINRLDSLEKKIDHFILHGHKK